MSDAATAAVGRLPAGGPAGTARLFAVAAPGLGPLLAAELATITGVQVCDSGHDGRCDVVLVTAEPTALRRLWAVRLAEDVFVEIGRTLRADGDRARWVARRLWRPTRVARAVGARARMGRPLRPRPTFRVIVRVLQERSFLRTDLRGRLTEVVARQQPQWRVADPSELEIWVVEYRPGKIIAGLRVSDARMRQHGGRVVERRGALLPTVAAAMVQLAGEPRGIVLDPCCGSGSILAEAAAVGWRVAGADVDPQAVRVARRNTPPAVVVQADARGLPYRQGAVDACISNLPFGRQFRVPDRAGDWLAAVLAELARVTRPGGRVVVLTPRSPGSAIPFELRSTERIPLRLRGTRTALWAYDRR